MIDTNDSIRAYQVLCKFCIVIKPFGISYLSYGDRLKLADKLFKLRWMKVHE